MVRFIPFLIILALLALSLWGTQASAFAWISVFVFGVAALIGIVDLFQTKHTLLRNFPVLGRLRWIAESLRPFFRSYVVESETEGKPFNHEERAMVYRRAKNVSSVEPFGSHLDIEKAPHEWVAHSIAAAHPDEKDPRILIGAPGTTQPYSASVLNISAMSFGSLGAHAIEALNRGAAKGGFFHDSGEGGVSRYHKAGGGDLVWELGSGYFGCRNSDGSFDPVQFKDTANLDQVKMIEVKLSQGAKPGHGGVLPGAKVTPEIAEARGIKVGETCYSPAHHTAFDGPKSMLDFIDQLRDLSGGKPVGFKLCIGNRWEFLAICKAMVETGQRADFIVIDGAEGGTGAAPAEFLDHVGTPLRPGLVFARNALVGCGLKDDVKLGASGKQVSAFNMAASLALGADWINTARGFMFALGCIQSLHCHNNTCPTGIATSDKGRQRGLVVADKAERVYHFHKNSVAALMEVVGSAGCQHPSELMPRHIMQSLAQNDATTADHLYNFLAPGALVSDAASTHLAEDWALAQSSSFAPA
ncbi:MAG: FMN-binding glutamate synthase family protein [Pseudomonadota bacterium]